MAKERTINMTKSQVIYKDYSKDAERTALVSGENLAHMFGKIARWYTDISWVGHTHTEASITDLGTYAGASTKGGAATSANKLNIGSADIGSETKPVYFSYLTGKPVACTYSLNASVPANAVFTDINVKQSPSTADESREVLFAGNTGNTETTGVVGKSNKLYFNPSTGALTATSFSGSLAASNLTGTIDAGRLPTTAVTAGSYGPAAGGTLAHGGTFDVAYVTVDKYGRLTAASTKTFTLPAQYVHPSYTEKTSGLYKITVDAMGHVSATAAVTAADLPAHTHNYISSSGITSTTEVQINPTGASYNEGLRIGKASNGWSNINFGCSNSATAGTQSGQWSVGVRGAVGATAGGIGDFIIEHNGASGNGLTLYADGSTPRWNNVEISMSGHTHPYLPESTVTGSPDLDTYLTTGVYHIKTQTSEHAPTTNHATLFVDGTVGTPYQLFIPDVSNGVWYSRYKSGTSAWSSWLSLKMTDTVYTHPTTSGNKHIPSGGSSGQYLKWSSDGTATWSAIAAADLPSHTHSYLPLSGGTMTGAITFQVADAIKYNAASATYTMITFITGDGNGHGISIGGGGLTVLGSGESASAIISALSLAASNETTYITSDNNIEFYSNCQTIGNRVGITYDTSGRLRPDTNNARTLGGTDYYWNKAYISQIVGRGTGGAWISARDNTVVRQPSMSTTSAYFPVISTKTKLGEWSIGTLGPDDESIFFAYTTDANYNAGTNTNKWCKINSDGAFSGSASKWTTARTLTIGSTGKSVDGSGNVSWSLSEIGAAATSHTHSNYLPQTTPTAAPDLNTYTSTGVYHIPYSSTNAPVTQHSTLYVEYGVGTPYQIFKPDNVDTTWYTRHRVSDSWSDWVALKLTDTVYTHPTYTSKASGLYKITVDGTGHVSATAAVTASDLPSHTHSYLPLAGGTMTGILKLLGSQYDDNYALDCQNSTIIGANAIKFADLADSAGEGIMFWRSSTTWDSIWAKNGVIYFTPNFPTDTSNYTVYHSGNLTYSTIGAASSSHTHGLLHTNLQVEAPNNTTNTWATIGVTGAGFVLKSIRTNANAAPYMLGNYAAGIVFGGSDTRGVITHAYDTPSIRFAGGNKTNTDGGTARWYFTLNATTGQSYTLPSTGGTLTDIIYKASNYYATSGHTHSYLPLSGGTMTGDITFTGVTSTDYPATSKAITFSGSTDAASIFYEVTASDRGCLVLQTTDDADAKIVFRNKVTASGTRANEVTIADGVISGNGSGLTNLNASNISSGTLAEARLPKAYIPLAGSTAITGSLAITMGSTAGPLVQVSNGTYIIGLHVGTGGTNHGIYDFTSSINAWMCYHDGTKNIFNGQANTAVTATKSTYTNYDARFNIQTGSSKQAKISLQTLINWLINTKKVLPADTLVHKIIQTGWAYADNDFLQISCNGRSYEIQLAGVALEFIGSVSSYNSGEFRLFIHTSPTTSGSASSGYVIAPTSTTFVYTCNGSGYSPTWKMISNFGKYAYDFWGLTDPNGNDNNWIRTTSNGIIPYQSGSLGSGHQSLGTSSWYFSYIYADQHAGYRLGLGSSSIQGRIDIQSPTTASVAYNSTNPRIRFMNAGGDQNIDIIMCDFDSVRGPAALSVHGNQGGEYLLAPNISAWDYTNNKLMAMLSAWSLGTTSAVGQGRVIAGNSTKKGTVGNARGYIEIYSEEDGCVFLVSPTTITTAQSGYVVTLPSSAGTLELVGHTHSQYLPKSTVTGSPDLDTYNTTGIYTINTSTAVHSPTTNYSTLFVDGSVGTPFQVLKPDANDTTWYTRHKVSGAWGSWVALTLNGVPNTDVGVSAAINKLSTGSSTPSDNDYYVAQYAGGGTTTTSYHRRPVSALFSYINSKLYKILWSGSTSCTARSSTSITLTTSISANKYRMIKVVWNCGSYTGVSEFRADTLNVTNNIPSGSDATTVNMIQFKIASDGKSVSVGPGTTTITVLQIAGVYPI